MHNYDKFWYQQWSWAFLTIMTSGVNYGLAGPAAVGRARGQKGPKGILFSSHIWRDGESWRAHFMRSLRGARNLKLSYWSSSTIKSFMFFLQLTVTGQNGRSWTYVRPSVAQVRSVIGRDFVHAPIRNQCSVVNLVRAEVGNEIHATITIFALTKVWSIPLTY